MSQWTIGPIPEDANEQQKYELAMHITEQAEADIYFAALVQQNLLAAIHEGAPHSQEEAERIERNNLGYNAGYFDSATRERVERLFHCAHPILGSIAEHPRTLEEVFEIGRMIGEMQRDIRAAEKE